MGAENEMVERLHERLTSAMRRSGRQPDAPVSVAEIYQELVPYQAVRSDVGFAMNADYEHALLRLLSGEGDHVRLDPPSARDAIVRELRGSNPNVGMYRDYAACDVWVRQVREDDVDTTAADDWSTDMMSALGADIDDDAADVITSVATFSIVDDEDDDAAGPDADDVGSTAAGQPDRPRSVADQPAAGQATSHAHRERCAYCDSSLPTHRRARYCPFCGADQTTQPCAACGESLEPGWTFCIACGVARGEDAG